MSAEVRLFLKVEKRRGDPKRALFDSAFMKFPVLEERWRKTSSFIPCHPHQYTSEYLVMPVYRKCYTLSKLIFNGNLSFGSAFGIFGMWSWFTPPGRFYSPSRS